MSESPWLTRGDREIQAWLEQTFSNDPDKPLAPPVLAPLDREDADVQRSFDAGFERGPHD